MLILFLISFKIVGFSSIVSMQTSIDLQAFRIPT